MMRIGLMVATVMAVGAAQPALAWYRGGGYAGGFAHGTVAGPNGAAHVSDAGGFWHGTAVGPDGVAHAGNSGGYWHGSSASWNGAQQPAVVNHYSAGCYNCGGWHGYAPGAVAVAGAAGVVAGAAIGAAAASAPPVYVPPPYLPPAYPVGAIYPTLPAGCAYSPIGGVAYYTCNGVWFTPAYGANGVYYRVAPGP